jgi:hypothetical protein
MGNLSTFIDAYFELYERLGAFEEPAQALPTKETLMSVCETLIDVSCMREEGRFSNFRVCFLRPENADFLDGYIYAHKLDFENPVPFTTSALHKLAPAINPAMSYLIIDTQSEPFMCTGIIASFTTWEKLIMGEVEGGNRMPQIPNIRVKDPGELEACFGETPLVGYSFGRNVVSRTDAFTKGLIYETINNFTHLRDTEWLHLLYRILWHVKKYAHGGTVLIVPSLESCQTFVDVKYKLPAKCMFEDSKSLIEVSPVAREKETISYADFLSKLTTVDGAVLLTHDFDLIGFGVEILTDKMETEQPKMCFLNSNDTINKTAKFTDNGTRHRSAYRFANAVPGAVAIVVSQDGIIKAITKQEDQVMVYNNIALAL